MALDTQEKRMAAAGVGRPWMRATFPSGTIDAEERASIGNTYGGNPFTGIVYAVSKGIFEYVAANWGSTLAFFFQVYHRATSGTLHARLFDVTTSTPVAGSDLSTVSATNVRQQSGDLKAALTDGDEYEAQWGKSGSDGGVADEAKMRIH